MPVLLRCKDLKSVTHSCPCLSDGLRLPTFMKLVCLISIKTTSCGFAAILCYVLVPNSCQATSRDSRKYWSLTGNSTAWSESSDRNKISSVPIVSNYSSECIYNVWNNSVNNNHGHIIRAKYQLWLFKNVVRWLMIILLHSGFRRSWSGDSRNH